MSILETCFSAAKKKTGTVVLPKGSDPRVAAAARRLADQQLARPEILGKADRIAASASQASVVLDGVITLDPAESDSLSRYASSIARHFT